MNAPGLREDRDVSALLQLRFVPDIAKVSRVLLRLEEGERASRALDADVFAALGWRIQGHGQLILSPLSQTPLPLPKASRRVDCAALVLPPRWDWGAGMRAGRATAWCRSPHPEGHPDLLWFEANSPSVPALALLRAGLHAQRALLLRASDEDLRMPADRWICDGCGWAGPEGALRALGDGAATHCPDCDRALIGGVA